MRRREESGEQLTNDELLEQCSKEELILLIKNMLRREPDLETLLLTVRKPQGAVTSQVYQRLVDRVFRSSGHEWGAAREIAEELDSIKDTADKFVEQGVFADAVTIYEVIVHTVLDNIYNYDDALHEGSFHGLVAGCVGQLGTCLDSVKDDQVLRERILQLLFAIYKFDVEAGGISLGDESSDVMLNQATADERHVIAAWVRKAIPTKDTNDWSNKYRQQWYGGFLLELEAGTLDDEAYLRICRETARTSDAVDRLLALARIDEAIKEARQVGDYDLMSIADIFVQHGHSSVAEFLITQRAATSSDTRLLEWLKKYYLSRNDKAKALEIAVDHSHLCLPITRKYACWQRC